MSSAELPDARAEVQVSEALTEPQAAAVLDLVARAARADGVAPLSEHGLLHVRYGDGPGGTDLLLRSGGRLAGYAHLDGPAGERTAELVIDPAQRRRGLGAALAGALTRQAGGRVQVWAHGDLPAAGALAVTAGFERTRVLLQLRRSLARPADEPRLPPGTEVRAFRPGQDEDAWTALNAAAFAAHPEQGSWTRADLERREREPWFDPAGFFLASRDGALAGFHWTKIHPDGPVGEVYVVGVDPAQRGTGLGRALTLIGLRYLRERGLPQVMLYVDESNTAAVALYESLGFARWSADVMFSGPGSSN
jgi:mycothiol synthase